MRKIWFLAATLSLIFTILISAKIDPASTKGDFLRYWLASSALIDGKNPYLEACPPTECNTPVFILPPGLILLLPIGIISFDFSLFVLRLFSLFTMFVVLIMYFPRKLQRTYDHIIFGISLFTLVPFWHTINLGQMSVVFMVCILLHLYLLEQKSNSSKFLSGLVLSPFLIKPHLIFLYLVGYSLWKKEDRISHAGFLTGFLLACLITQLIYPDLLSMYLLAQPDSFSSWFNPTLGAWLQYFVDIELGWLRFLPAIIYIAILPLTNAKRFHDKSGIRELIIGSSLLFTPYIWAYDYLLLVPLVFVSLKTSTRSSNQLLLSLYILILSGIVFSLPPHWHILYPIITVPLCYLLLYSNLIHEPRVSNANQ